MVLWQLSQVSFDTSFDNEKGFIVRERWRVIPGHPEYKVSDYGSVFSERLGRPLKQHLSLGYPTVHLSVNGVPKPFGVHRLVALAFVPGQFDGAFVNHIDGNKAKSSSNQPKVVHPTREYTTCGAHGFYEYSKVDCDA